MYKAWFDIRELESPHEHGLVLVQTTLELITLINVITVTTLNFSLSAAVSSLRVVLIQASFTTHTLLFIGSRALYTIKSLWASLIPLLVEILCRLIICYLAWLLLIFITIGRAIYRRWVIVLFTIKTRFLSDQGGAI
jgi:hypothetical protein